MDKKMKDDDIWRPKPGVINTELIKKAMNKMAKDDVPGNNIDEEEGYEFHEITHLYMEHMDILQIDHLWIVPALRVLKLTGNFIDKIQNLDSLVNLVDLNLSFNRIQTIENLNKLTKLRHLSLFSNLITEIQNLDQLQELKIFTIGRNKILYKESILHLRNLGLFSLNMADNPCSLKEGFRNYVAAYLPHVKYYEYIKISEDERELGREMYLSALEVLERDESTAQKTALEASARTEEEELHALAFVEALDLDQLYQCMMDSDPQGVAMMLVGEEVVSIFDKFKENIGSATKEIFKLGLEQHRLREKEVEMFLQGSQSAITKSRAKQRLILEKFLENKAEMFVEMSEFFGMLSNQAGSEESMKKSIEEKVDKANLLCMTVKKQLLNLELILSEQLKEVFALFERSLGDMVNAFIESAQGLFTTMRELETVFGEQLGDHTTRFHTQMSIRNEDVSTLPPPLRPIMLDKETLNNALSTSHDIHLQVIDNREDQLMNRARNWYQKLCTDYEQEETTRFRERISEIVNFLELQAKEFQQYNVPLEEDIYA